MECKSLNKDNCVNNMMIMSSGPSLFSSVIMLTCNNQQYLDLEVVLIFQRRKHTDNLALFKRKYILVNKQRI